MVRRSLDRERIYTDYTGVRLNIQKDVSPVYTNAAMRRSRAPSLNCSGSSVTACNRCRDQHQCVLHQHECEHQHFPAVAGLPDEPAVIFQQPRCRSRLGGVARSMRSFRTPEYGSRSIRGTTTRSPSAATVRCSLRTLARKCGRTDEHAGDQAAGQRDYETYCRENGIAINKQPYL